ncbi:MAG TPA: HAD family hydrolase [Acidobacteriota bacterium]|nr:HAD family hydrolase [Acidobacteriota bacterium]
MKRSFRGIIFDLDGVLVDSYECWYALVNDALKLTGRRPATKAEFDATWGQGPDADQASFFPSWSVDQILRYYDDHFADYAKNVRVMDGAADTLAALRSKGLLLAVASNSPRKIVEVLLQHAKLLDYFESIVGFDEVVHGKPEPDLILHVLEHWQMDRSDAFYVGDSPFDAEAAKKAEIFFVGFRRPGDATISQLAQLSDFV